MKLARYLFRLSPVLPQDWRRLDGRPLLLVRRKLPRRHDQTARHLHLPQALPRNLTGRFSR